MKKSQKNLSYNQALINHGNLTIWFDPNTQWYAKKNGKQGLSPTDSDAAIQCCLRIKSLFRLTLCMVTGFVRSLIKLSDLDWTVPDYSTLCRRQKHIDIAISYQKSHDGLHLLVDSTELKFWMRVTGNGRNISLNIVDNGVNYI